MRIYLAGPEVFLPQPLQAAAAKKEICTRFGFTGVFPLDNEIDLAGRGKSEQGLAISAANEELMRGCDLTVANMTPFRGPSIDPGTAFEMGFMRALGRPVYGYSNDARNFLERTREALAHIAPSQPPRRREDGSLEDHDALQMEDFQLHDNLMLEGAIHASGGAFVSRNAPAAERFTNLTAFEECVRLAAERLL